MKWFAWVFGVAMITSPTAYAQNEWRPIFNGVDLDGWQQTGPGRFVIEEGVLRTEGGMGLLWYTREKFGDATLRVVFRVPEDAPAGNSGVFIRIPREPSDPWAAVNSGYEVQIDETGDDLHRTGVLYSFTKAKAKPPLREWNVMEIALDGDRTVVKVNDVVVTDFREGDAVPPKRQPYEPTRGPRPRNGYIGLQNHDPRDVVLFKEVSVRKGVAE